MGTDCGFGVGNLQLDKNFEMLIGQTRNIPNLKDKRSFSLVSFHNDTKSLIHDIVQNGY